MRGNGANFPSLTSLLRTASAGLVLSGGVGEQGEGYSGILAILALPLLSVLIRWMLTHRGALASRRACLGMGLADLAIALGVGFILYAGEMGVLAVGLLTGAKVAGPFAGMHAATIGISGFLLLSLISLRRAAGRKQSA